MTDRMPRVDIPPAAALAPGRDQATGRAEVAAARSSVSPADGGRFRAVLAERPGPGKRAPAAGTDPARWTPGRPSGAQRSAEAAGGAGEPAAGGKSGRGRWRGISPGEEGGIQAAERTLALLAPWQIQEGPPRAPPPRPLGVALPPAAVERLLVGAGPRGVEARLRLGHGPLAGTEIHLRHLPGGVEAVVLTRVESSRQTLAVAMEEVARRLQRKGYAFRVTVGMGADEGSGVADEGLGRETGAGSDLGGGGAGCARGDR
jgi:hypothetical protein